MTRLSIRADIEWDVKEPDVKPKIGRPYSENPGYVARHARVYSARGKAADYACEMNCGRAAKEWATIHDMTGLDVCDYWALCRQCHYAYDIDSRPKDERNKVWVPSHA